MVFDDEFLHNVNKLLFITAQASKDSSDRDEKIIKEAIKNKIKLMIIDENKNSLC